ERRDRRPDQRRGRAAQGAERPCVQLDRRRSYLGATREPAACAKQLTPHPTATKERPMFTLQIAFSTQEELQDFVAQLGGEPAQGVEPTASADKPARRRRSKKDDAKTADSTPTPSPSVAQAAASVAPAAGGA